MNKILDLFTSKFYNNQDDKKIINDSFWLMISQVFMIASGILIVFIITFKLGTSKFGVYSQILALYNILSILFAIGIDNVILKKIAEKKFNSKEQAVFFGNNLLSTFGQVSLLSFIVYLISIYFPNWFSSNEVANNLYLVLLAIPFFNVNKDYNAYFSGIRDQLRFSLNRIFRWAVTLLVVIISVFGFESFKLALLSFFIAEVSLAILNTFFLRNKINFGNYFEVMKFSYRFAIQTYVAKVISVIMLNLDIIILGYFISKSDVGIYSFIVLIARTLLVFPSILAQNLNPLFSQHWVDNNKTELKKLILKYGKLNSAIISLQLVVLFISYYFIIKFYKTEFINTYLYFFIAIIGIYISAIPAFLGGIFIMIGKNKMNNIRTFVLLIIFVITFGILGSQLKLLGGAIAILINGIIQFIILYNLVNLIIANKIK